jgi:hypothetical protein
MTVDWTTAAAAMYGPCTTPMAENAAQIPQLPVRPAVGSSRSTTPTQVEAAETTCLAPNCLTSHPPGIWERT